MDNIIAEDLKILVYRSNIDTPEKVARVGNELAKANNIYRVDVDLEDQENVLRLECHPTYSSTEVEQQVSRLGFRCSELS